MVYTIYFKFFAAEDFQEHQQVDTRIGATQIEVSTHDIKEVNRTLRDIGGINYTEENCFVPYHQVLKIMRGAYNIDGTPAANTGKTIRLG